MLSGLKPISVTQKAPKRVLENLPRLSETPNEAATKGREHSIRSYRSMIDSSAEMSAERIRFVISTTT